jgi:hypothetical protein
MSLNLTVFFEDPFWVGLFSIVEGQLVRYCRVVFGGEPSDIEIYQYLHSNYRNLQFSEALQVYIEEPKIKNPKRRQREANRKLQQTPGEKKSYAVIKQTLQSQQKEIHQIVRKQNTLEHEEYVHKLKQIKRKEKHKGH